MILLIKNCGDKEYDGQAIVTFPNDYDLSLLAFEYVVL